MELEKVKEIVAGILHMKPEEIRETSDFADDLGADSLDLFQILLQVEEVYDIEIENEAAEQIQTVGDAARLIRHSVTQ